MRGTWGLSSGRYDSCCQFWRTWTIVRNYRDFLAYVAWNLCCYIEVLWSFLHASHCCCKRRLEVENHIAVRTLTEYAEVESALHRRLDTIENFASCYQALRYLLLLEARNP